MTPVLSGGFLAAYAAENDNRPSRGVNGTDQLMAMPIAVDRAGMDSAAASRTAAVRLPAGDVGLERSIQEGYSSAAGLGLVLIMASAGGLVTLGLAILGALSGSLG